MADVITAPPAAPAASELKPALVQTTPALASEPSVPAKDHGGELAQALGLIQKERVPDEAEPIVGPSAEPGSPVPGQELALPATDPEALSATEAPAEPQFDAEGNPIPAPAAMPGDDYLAELDKMRFTEDAPAKPGDDPKPAEDDLTDEAIDAIANPEGVSSAVEQYTNLRSAYGRQSSELGTLRKAAKIEIGKSQEFQRQIGQFEKYVGFDAETNTIAPQPEFVIHLADKVPHEGLKKLLAERNQMIVPLDFKGDTTDPLVDVKAALDIIIPGDDLTFEEKLAEKDSLDPEQRALYEDKLADLKTDRLLSKREAASNERMKERHSQHQEQVKSAEIQKSTDAFVAELAKRTGGTESPEFKRAAVVINHWNTIIPAGMEILNRHKLLYQLVQADQAPDRFRKFRDDLLGNRIAHNRLNSNAAGALPTGEVPTIVENRLDADPISDKIRADMKKALL